MAQKSRLHCQQVQYRLGRFSWGLATEGRLAQHRESVVQALPLAELQQRAEEQPVVVVAKGHSRPVESVVQVAAPWPLEGVHT